MSPKQRIQAFATVVTLYAVLTACVTWREVLLNKKSFTAPNRGIIVNHERHLSEGLECSDCHEATAGERMSFVDHETCSLCHEIPENSLEQARTFSQEVSCKKCHTRADYSVHPKRQLITDEIKFDHQIHITAEVNCAQCHENPDHPLPKTGVLMQDCMQCHQETTHLFSGIAQRSTTTRSFTENECIVCHTTLSLDTVPLHRHGRRIAHDSSVVWGKVHGQEANLDTAYCAQCHNDQDHCAACHRITKPSNHTLAWNRKLHGAHAEWNSQSCSVCHEEDSCIKCHRSTSPRSHRTGFSSPTNNHCVSCHVPVENSCSICHEDIDHATAIRTPHDAGGGSPGNCALCHPGGLAGNAPHRVNATLSCRACHE